MALCKLGDERARSAILAFSGMQTQLDAEKYVKVIIHLNPKEALKSLEIYGQHFHYANWVPRLRGIALSRLGHIGEAQNHLKRATQKRPQSVDWLTLGHYYLERGDFVKSRKYIQKAFKFATPKDRARCVLSQAVISWYEGNHKNAINLLADGQRRFRLVADVEELHYEYLWESKTLQAVKEMLQYLSNESVKT